MHANVGIGLGWTLVLVMLAVAGQLGAQGAILAALLHNLSTFLGLANAGRLILFDETGTDGRGDPRVAGPGATRAASAAVV